MRRFIQLSYDGAAYHGWQKQPNARSVQQTLQETLSMLLQTDIEVVGAGRTDAGVSARMMVAHFETDKACDNEQLVYKLNKLLPHDIAVQRIWEVPDEMHARFSATSRTYHYYIHTRKDPFVRQYSWLVTFPLDFARMNEAASRLADFDDFTSFSKVNTDTKTNLCNVTEARWTQEGENTWRFTITANRFLRNMVRAIVGTLIEIGRGRMTVDEFCQVIEQKNRCSAGDSVPGHALFLVDVSY